MGEGVRRPQGSGLPWLCPQLWAAWGSLGLSFSIGEMGVVRPPWGWGGREPVARWRTNTITTAIIQPWLAGDRGAAPEPPACGGSAGWGACVSLTAPPSVLPASLPFSPASSLTFPVSPGNLPEDLPA